MTPKTEAPPPRLPADAPLDDRLFGAVFEHGADGVLVSRPDGTILRANPAACRMLGLSEEELRRLGRGGFVVEDAALRAFVAAREANGVAHGELLHRRADGTTYPAEVTSAILPAASGERFALVVFRDVSHRRQQQDELSRSAAALRTALEKLQRHVTTTPLAVVEWDAELRVTGFSRRAEELFGWTAAEVMGKCIHELPWIPEEDWPLVRRVMAGMSSGALPASVNASRNLRRDGSVLHCEWYTSAVHDAQGRLASVLSLVLDVTARVAAEARAESLARFPEENPDPVLRLSAGGAVVWANAASRELLAQLGGRGGAVPAELSGPGLEALARGEGLRTEVRAGARSFALHYVPVGADVNVYGQDVTERKRVEEALVEADQRKDEFLAVLSHEIRNPLAPILNSVVLLDRIGDPSEAAGRARAVIERQARHLAEMVDDLLDLTRISHGKIQLDRGVHDARELVRRAVEDHRLAFEQRGIALSCEVPDVPLWIDADPTRVAQVLGNLLHNAAKFTPRGGTTAVSAREAGAAAELSVRDDGAGVAPELLERLFQPFVQADRTLARSQGGLGLGLALVRRLVELHGGAVSARSDGAGRGTEIALTLPLVAAPAAPAPVPGAAHASPCRVVVVEDNLDAGDSLAELLRLYGHEVRIARDGLTGIALAREARPDVVLCDIGLPDLSGHEVARALRSDASLAATRLVALSGYALPEDRRRAAEAGFDDHVAKPPTLEALARVLSAPAPTRAGGG